MRDQIETGLAVAEKLMERRCMMVCSSDKTGLANVIRRAMTDAVPKFESVAMDKMHHVGYIDFSKFGRLTQPDVENAALWCQRVLNLNDNYSHFHVTICLSYMYM